MKKEFLSVSVLCKSVAKKILPGNGKTLEIGNPLPKAHFLTYKQREKKETIGTIPEIEK